MSDWKLENLPKEISIAQSEQEKRTTVPQYPNGIFQKITDPFDFQPKFLDFFW